MTQNDENDPNEAIADFAPFPRGPITSLVTKETHWSETAIEEPLTKTSALGGGVCMNIFLLRRKSGNEMTAG